MSYEDTPEIAARRQEIDAKLGPVQQRLGQMTGTGIDVAGLRLKCYLEYLAEKLGDRNEAEALFLSSLEEQLDQASAVIARATLLGGVQAR